MKTRSTFLSLAIILSIVSYAIPSKAAPFYLSNQDTLDIISCFTDNESNRLPTTTNYFYQDALPCIENYKKLPAPYHKHYEVNEILEYISNIPIDRRGTWINFDPYREVDFIHWNPAFITWVERHFVLLNLDPYSPEYQARLKIYLANRYQFLRMAYAWEYLNKYNDIEVEAKKYQKANLGQFKGRMLFYLARFRPDPRQNYDDGSFNEELEPECWSEAEYNDEIYGFRYDVGFWLRRQLDGTATQMSSLLSRIIELYDPQSEEARAFFTK
ncbi:MAG: hypothetical protein LBE31_01910 [Deltaproteobacteria bacterium]|jgi:hypothetical protein|nr:hypothetical protein [Deltaproteobacteria bacterium]